MTPMRKGQPVPTRSAARSRVLVPLALAVGALLVVLGLIVAVSVGPAGRVEITRHVDAPGITIVGEGVTRAGSAPVHVRAAADSGGSVTLSTALPEDAAAMVGDARVTTISGIRFLPRSLDVETSGTGQLPRALNEDVVVGRAQGAPAELDVELSRLPLSVVVLPGAAGQPREEPVDVTMTWTNPAWFWQGVGTALVGAALLVVGAVIGRRRGSAADRPPTAVMPAARERSRRDDMRSHGEPSSDGTSVDAAPVSDDTSVDSGAPSDENDSGAPSDEKGERA